MDFLGFKAPALTKERERELVLFLKENNLEVRNLSLLNLAFIHTSYANEVRGDCDSYERLEFLGDAVLDLVTAEYLFQNFYGRYHEGDFSKIKAMVVSEDSLFEVAHQRHFENFLLIGKGEASQGGAMKKAIQADVLEAVIAAVYLDSGLGAARDFVLSFIPCQVEKVLKNRVYYKDYKTKLQEYWQKKKGRIPQYTLEGVEGPDHEQVFHVSVTLGEKNYGSASGKSKKHAEQNAAKLALIHLGLEPNDGSVRDRD